MRADEFLAAGEIALDAIKYTESGRLARFLDILALFGCPEGVMDILTEETFAWLAMPTQVPPPAIRKEVK